MDLRTAQKAKAVLKETVCRDFAAGRECRRGRTCWYSHELSTPAADVEAATGGLVNLDLNTSTGISATPRPAGADTVNGPAEYSREATKRAKERRLEEIRTKKLGEELQKTPCKNYAEGKCTYGVSAISHRFSIRSFGCQDLGFQADASRCRFDAGIATPTLLSSPRRPVVGRFLHAFRPLSRAGVLA